MEQQDKLEDTQAALVAHLDKELGEDLFEWRTGYKIFFWLLRWLGARRNDSCSKRFVPKA